MSARAEFKAQVMHNLSHHAPRTEETTAQIVDLRWAAKTFAELILDHTPPCREQSLSITNLEQTLQWAIGAIVRNQIDPDPEDDET